MSQPTVIEREPFLTDKSEILQWLNANAIQIPVATTPLERGRPLAPFTADDFIVTKTGEVVAYHPILFRDSNMSQLRVKFKSVPTLAFQNLPLFTDLTGCPSKTKMFHLRNLPLLATLAGAPKEVNDSVDIEFCQGLTSLKHIPLTHRNYSIIHCAGIINLKGLNPGIVDDCRITYCPNLTSLIGAPCRAESFNCSHNPKLKNLRGGPRIVEKGYYAKHCTSLKSLVGGPEVCYGSLWVTGSFNLTEIDSFIRNMGNIIKLEGEPEIPALAKPSTTLLTAVLDQTIEIATPGLPWITIVKTAQLSGDTLTMYGELAQLGYIKATKPEDTLLAADLDLT